GSVADVDRGGRWAVGEQVGQVFAEPGWGKELVGGGLDLGQRPPTQLVDELGVHRLPTDGRNRLESWEIDLEDLIVLSIVAGEHREDQFPVPDVWADRDIAESKFFGEFAPQRRRRCFAGLEPAAGQ